MNIEEARSRSKPGWNKLIDKVYAITELLTFATVAEVNIRHSMLQIIFEPTLDKHQQYVLDCIAYKIERESALTCQDCGISGVRRKALPGSPNLCTACYAIQYSDYVESVSPQVTNQEPQ